MYGYSVLLIASLAIGAGFFVRAVTGFAAALIALPILLFVMPPQMAVGLLAMYFFIFSSVMLFINRKKLDKRLLLHLGIAILIGLFIGTTILKNLDPIILLRGLGIFHLVYLGYHHFLRDKMRIPNSFGIVIGLTGGIFSGVAASGGSLYASYMHDHFDDALLMRANTIGIIGVADLMRLPVFLYRGIFTWETGLLALTLLPIFGLAVWFGHKFHERIEGRVFKRAISCVIAMAAVVLILH